MESLSRGKFFMARRVFSSRAAQTREGARRQAHLHDSPPERAFAHSGGNFDFAGIPGPVLLFFRPVLL